MGKARLPQGRWRRGSSSPRRRCGGGPWPSGVRRAVVATAVGGVGGGHQGDAPGGSWRRRFLTWAARAACSSAGLAGGGNWAARSVGSAAWGRQLTTVAASSHR
jgi:hypothetical protein